MKKYVKLYFNSLRMSVNWQDKYSFMTYDEIKADIQKTCCAQIIKIEIIESEY